MAQAQRPHFLGQVELVAVLHRAHRLGAADEQGAERAP